MRLFPTLIQRQVASDLVQVGLLTYGATLSLFAIIHVMANLDQLSWRSELDELTIAIPQLVIVASYLASSFAFIRCTRDGMITVLRSTGINPLTLVWPVVFLAIVSSASLVEYYNGLYPSARARLIASSAPLAPYVLDVLRDTGRLATTDSEFTLTVDRVERGTMHTVRFVRHKGGPFVDVTASTGRIEVDSAERRIYLFLFTVTETAANGRQTTRERDSFELPLPLDWVHQLAVTASWRELNDRIAANDRSASKEFHRRASICAAAGLMCLVGALGSLGLSQSNAFGNFLTGVVPVLMAYYPLRMIAYQDPGLVTVTGSPVGYWIGEIGLAAASLGLLHRVTRT